MKHYKKHGTILNFLNGFKYCKNLFGVGQKTPFASSIKIHLDSLFVKKHQVQYDEFRGWGKKQQRKIVGQNIAKSVS